MGVPPPPPPPPPPGLLQNTDKKSVHIGAVGFLRESVDWARNKNPLSAALTAVQVVFRENVGAFLMDKENSPRTVRNNEVSVVSECPQSGVRVYVIVQQFI